MSLADRVRAAREQWVTVGGYKFNVRRPTMVQVRRMIVAPPQKANEMLLACVIGWNVLENELVPGGGGAAAPFEPEAFVEWLEDHAQIYDGLFDEIAGIVKRRVMELGELEKKS